MPTINQLIRSPRSKQIKRNKVPALENCPQKRGVCTRVYTTTPKKPNSAIRHVVKISLTNGLRLKARIPGKGYICVRYNRLLVEGGRANDLPGIGYTAIRGVYDFLPVVGKIKRRSVYGVSRPIGFTKYIRKSLRR